MLNTFISNTEIYFDVSLDYLIPSLHTTYLMIADLTRTKMEMNATKNR